MYYKKDGIYSPMALSTIPSVDMVAHALNPSLWKGTDRSLSSRPSHLRNNQTKSLTLSSPHCFHFHLMISTANHKCRKFTSPRQYHHFTNGQCLTGILLCFFSGCRRKYESCCPHVSDHSNPQLLRVYSLRQNISGKTAY